MTTFDLTPLFRAAIGFNRLVGSPESATQADTGVCPTYDIELLGEDRYRITLAVPGFSLEHLEVETLERHLRISGHKDPEDEGRRFLQRGIATHDFMRDFLLPDHVRITGATIRDGLLFIDLLREVPEAVKPQRIDIHSGLTDLLEGHPKAPAAELPTVEVAEAAPLVGEVAETEPVAAETAAEGPATEPFAVGGSEPEPVAAETAAEEPAAEPSAVEGTEPEPVVVETTAEEPTAEPSAVEGTEPESVVVETTAEEPAAEPSAIEGTEPEPMTTETAAEEPAAEPSAIEGTEPEPMAAGAEEAESSVIEDQAIETQVAEALADLTQSTG